jgi:hypothetical protein
MKHNYVIYFITLFILLSFTRCDSTDSSTASNETETIAEAPATPEKEKSKEEIIVDGTVKVIDALTPLIEQGIQNKRHKDSTRAAEKDEFWVFTVGVPYNDINTMAEAFEKIQNIENMAVFEESGEYIIIRRGSSKEQLQDLQGSFKSALDETNIGINRIDIKNLADKCGKRGHIVSGQDRKLKRKYPEIPCYRCN